MSLPSSILGENAPRFRNKTHAGRAEGHLSSALPQVLADSAKRLAPIPLRPRPQNLRWDKAICNLMRVNGFEISQTSGKREVGSLVRQPNCLQPYSVPRV